MSDRIGIKVNLHQDLDGWIHRLERGKYLSKTKLVTAALAALTLLSEEEQAQLFAHAQAIDDQDLTWDTWLTMCEKSAKVRERLVREAQEQGHARREAARRAKLRESP